MVQQTDAQVRIHGAVFDVSKKRPLEGVSVLTNKSGGTTTDLRGNYSIWVDPGDSIYFSYLGKATIKYEVRSISTISNFDISLQAKSDMLPEVIVRQRSYRDDSLQNRLEYAKIFNYNKPRLHLNAMDDGGGQESIGFDLDQFIDIFRFDKKKHTLAFQNRLIEDENDRYVSYKFNKGLVRRLTGLEGPMLDTFMKKNRPDYYFVKRSNEYELYDYIKRKGEEFKTTLSQQEKNIKTP